MRLVVGGGWAGGEEEEGGSVRGRETGSNHDMTSHARFAYIWCLGCYGQLRIGGSTARLGL